MAVKGRLTFHELAGEAKVGQLQGKRAVAMLFQQDVLPTAKVSNGQPAMMLALHVRVA